MVKQQRCSLIKCCTAVSQRNASLLLFGGAGFFVDGGFGESSEFFIGGLFLLERFLEERGSVLQAEFEGRARVVP